VATVENELQGW